MKLLLATDAWHPQMNGVVRTLSTVVDTLRAAGHSVEVIGVGDFPALPMPSYPEIKVSVWLRGLTARIEAFDPDAIHISTEGPIGYAARRFCRRHGYAFTTSFHTRFPEYLRERLPVPLGLTYAMVRAFHRHASRTLVPTQTLKTDLEQRGFSHLQIWGRGVDTALFAPERRQDSAWTRPLWLNVGRAEQLNRFLAREKDPLKQWKLSWIDVEGLNRWDAYTDAIGGTLERTHTDHAPWTIVRSDDKRRARVVLARPWASQSIR